MKRRSSSVMSTKDGPEPRFSIRRSRTNFQTTKRALVASGPEGVDPLIPQSSSVSSDDDHNDRFNYAILIALYTLQGIPMGLSASIPFLIQQKLKVIASAALPAAAAGSAITSGASAASSAAAAARLSYNANAIFALCSWPFSLKLLWAPIVDAVYFRSFGRRKSWLVPVQAMAGLLMVFGSSFVERQLGLGHGIGMDASAVDSFNVKGVTIFFFALYFLMATQGKN
jgi:PAT family acetyl-CoA transporter-like MFS transporter 1